MIWGYPYFWKQTHLIFDCNLSSSQATTFLVMHPPSSVTREQHVKQGGSTEQNLRTETGTKDDIYIYLYTVIYIHDHTCLYNPSVFNMESPPFSQVVGIACTFSCVCWLVLVYKCTSGFTRQNLWLPRFRVTPIIEPCFVCKFVWIFSICAMISRDIHHLSIHTICIILNICIILLF